MLKWREVWIKVLYMGTLLSLAIASGAGYKWG